MQYKCNTVYLNRLAVNCPSSECIETQLSSTRQEVGLDGDTVVPDYVSKLNYDIKASDDRRSVIKGQKFDSSKFEKVLGLSRKWAQKRNWPGAGRGSVSTSI